MLIAEKISKRFAGITALDDVTMELLPGKVTAIVGENGAGKSTLMKILSGVYQEYDGRILFQGDEVRFKNPKEAQESGIAIIHQELNLIPYLSITENIFLGREIVDQWGLLNKKAMRHKTQELLNKLKLNVTPDTNIQELKVGQQQVVEIAKALLTDAQVIIMDEPTSAISDHEVEILFGIINDLRAENKIIVYISHKLDELFKIADRYIVLRDGRVTESGELKGVSHEAIIQKMVGREVKVLDKQQRTNEHKELLSIQQLSLSKGGDKKKVAFENITFELHAGEILGIFGLMGAGRTELLETIMGVRIPSSGAVHIEQQRANLRSSHDAINAGIVLVPEDRKQDGIIPGLDVKKNISLSALGKVQRAGMLSERKELELAKRYTDSLRIKATSSYQQVKMLSGGNQQKVVLARCLATNPKVLMLDEPTRGIDANAKNEIYKLIRELAKSGLGIIMVSSELPEILAVSDRVLVMAEGRLTAEFSSAEATEDSILKAAIPKTI